MKSIQKGFTLVEVLVVLTIIMVLGAIAVPQYNKYKSKSKRSNAYAKMNEIIKAQDLIYSNIGAYVPVTGTLNRGPNYVGDETIFEACAANTECHEYNFIHYAGDAAEEYLHRRADILGDGPEAYSGFAATQATLAAACPNGQANNQDCFYLIAAGDIDDDAGTSYADVLAYTSATAEITHECDDLKNETNCNY